MTISLTLTPNGKNVKLTKAYYVLSKYLDEEIRIPIGFVSDLASIPRAFHVILPRMGKYTIPAIVHDYLYESGIVERYIADKIFYELMKKHDVPYLKRQIMYRAVRMCGWVAWNNHRRYE